jgi:ketosteroid isomerase-like protein
VPSANVDLVRSIVEAWERGDYGSAEWADANIEFVFVDGPSPGRWIGPAGMAAANRDWLSAWRDVRQEIDEYRELDDQRVLVLHRFSASGRASGLHTEQIRADGAALFQISEGKVVRLVHYFDRGRALADLDPGADAAGS